MSFLEDGIVVSPLVRNVGNGGNWMFIVMDHSPITKHQ